LFDFDWKNFQIVIAGAPGDRKSSAAQLLTDYATYYEKFTPTTSTRQRFDAASTTPTVVIETGARRGIGFDAANPRVLRIIGRDDFDAQQLAWRLARLLDARYPQMP